MLTYIRIHLSKRSYQPCYNISSAPVCATPPAQNFADFGEAFRRSRRPSIAQTQTTRSPRARSSMAVSYAAAPLLSILFSITSRGSSPAPRPSSVSSTTSSVAHGSLSAESRTSSSRSAFAASSSVARNAATTLGRQFSDETDCVREQKQLSVAGLYPAHDCVERRKELIFRKDARVLRERAPAAWTSRCSCSRRAPRAARRRACAVPCFRRAALRTSSSRFVMLFMRSSSLRRWRSNSVSPGPRVPMPPPVRDI